MAILKVSETISEKDSQKVILTMNLNEGEPTYVKEISLQKKIHVYGDEIEKMFDDLKGQIFNKFDIEDTYK